MPEPFDTILNLIAVVAFASTVFVWLAILGT